MKLNFRQEVLVLPASVLSHLDVATPEQLRVLLWLASDLSLVSKHRQLAKLAGCDPTVAQNAVAFWCARGILGEAGEAVPAMATVSEVEPVKKKLQRADELPNYTSTEIAELLNFSTVYTFSRAYKDYFGVCPMATKKGKDKGDVR